ncbi:MAG: pyridoxal 5'-phosphate synthase glutaminase subunit PdxT [Candidatus Zixiibacteriota bacterium]
MTKARVGILALQGDFALHQAKFVRLGANVTLVKTTNQLSQIDRLVIPGGESTTMQLLMDRFGLRQPVIAFGKEKPTWGTCAGLILLAREVDNPLIRPLGLIDIKAKRNAYGRQVDSFIADGTVTFDQTSSTLEMVFIRAPKIIGYADSVMPLGYCDGDVVVARQDNILVTSFHPELTDQTIVHKYFLEM